ncbi:MAG: Possible hydrolase or acyltransferase RutD in novel pyrimidine catabolism pathway, partial [uncultured Acetobacteraceae bacterium]
AHDANRRRHPLLRGARLRSAPPAHRGSRRRRLLLGAADPRSRAAFPRGHPRPPRHRPIQPRPHRLFRRADGPGRARPRGRPRRRSLPFRRPLRRRRHRHPAPAGQPGPPPQRRPLRRLGRARSAFRPLLRDARHAAARRRPGSLHPRASTVPVSALVDKRQRRGTDRVGAGCPRAFPARGDHAQPHRRHHRARTRRRAQRRPHPHPGHGRRRRPPHPAPFLARFAPGHPRLASGHPPDRRAFQHRHHAAPVQRIAARLAPRPDRGHGLDPAPLRPLRHRSPCL